MRRRAFLTAGFALFASSLTARIAKASGWASTGSGFRVKNLGFFTVKIYSIRHEVMAGVPKNRQAIIAADIHKRFVWIMQRDMLASKLKADLQNGFDLNGYTNQAKINQFLAAFGNGTIQENAVVTFTYNPNTDSTAVNVFGATNATVAGYDFMQAVWSIYFGESDQPALGDELMSLL